MSDKPKTGELWETETGERVFIVGYRRDGQIVCESVSGIDWNMLNTTDWRRVPDYLGSSGIEKPEVTDHEKDVLAALANLRDNLEKFGRRLEKIEGWPSKLLGNH